MLTLHYSPGACSLAPHIALEETGATYCCSWCRSRKASSGLPSYAAFKDRMLRRPAVRTVLDREESRLLSA